MATLIRISSARDGFRRAGIAHSVAPRDYAPEDFSDEQLHALFEEPMLAVAAVEVADPQQPINPETLPSDDEGRSNGVNVGAGAPGTPDAPAPSATADSTEANVTEPIAPPTGDIVPAVAQPEIATAEKPAGKSTGKAKGKK